MGDPCGIGPEVLARYLDREGPPEDTGLIVTGDASLLRSRLSSDTGNESSIEIFTSRPEDPPGPEEVQIWGVTRDAVDEKERGAPLQKGGEAAMSYLKKSFSLCQEGKADGLVTGPISKQAIARSNRSFSGHTEWLAGRLGIQHPVMGIVSGNWLAVTVTRHVPVRKIPLQLNEDRIVSMGESLSHDLETYFGVSDPKIGISGLNPHAGESGLIGREELDVISPAVDRLVSKGIEAEGPRSAESLLNEEGFSTYDAVVTMFHDQALVPLKARGLDRCASVTLGLDMVRTSVAHGTGFGLIGTNRFSEQSLSNAVELAAEMVHNQSATS